MPSQHQQPMTMTPQMSMVMQQQQQQIMMMKAQMQQMQMTNGGQQRFSMQQRQGSSGAVVGNRNVMGAMGGHGVATSFAFMEDPTTAKKDASNKKFDFVQDAMKSAK
jgi:triacylglycerol esterase/lipase EstA (alpha/beta hydrolase family)